LRFTLFLLLLKSKSTIMKKVYIALFSLFIFSLESQTLSQSFTEPKVGDVNSFFRFDTSGYTTGMPLNVTGPGTMWDFSKLQTASGPYSLAYASPSAVAGASNYPTATVVQNDPALTVYLKSTATPTTQTEILGMVLPAIGLTTTFTNSAIAAIYPVSMGSTLSDNLSGSFSSQQGSGTCSGKSTYTADGTGTLTLANGLVFKNVIRMKSILTVTATIGFPVGNLKITTYDYYDATQQFPVLSLSYSSLVLVGGTPTITGGATGNSKASVGIPDNQINSVAFEVFPNPATHHLFVSGGKIMTEGKIEITNAMGQMVKSLQTEPGVNQSVDVADLPPGFYTVTYSSSGSRGVRKFMIE
jgi:hypothetical protein